MKQSTKCKFGFHAWSQWEDDGIYVQVNRLTGEDGAHCYGQKRRCTQCNQLDTRIVIPRREHH